MLVERISLGNIGKAEAIATVAHHFYRYMGMRASHVQGVGKYFAGLWSAAGEAFTARHAKKAYCNFPSMKRKEDVYVRQILHGS